MNELFTLANLIFLAPLVVGVILFLLLAMVSGFDGHGDADVHADAHAELHSDVHADPDFDNDATPDGHHVPEGSVGQVAAVLAFFGIGKVPLNIVLFSWVIIWGVVGYTMNLLLTPQMVVLNAVIAAFSAVFGTRYLARGLARILPNVETYSQQDYDFLLQEATVAYTIRRDSGAVRIYDRHGRLRELPCRLTEGQVEILPGQQVMLDDFNEVAGTYSVTVMDDFGGRSHKQEECKNTPRLG